MLSNRAHKNEFKLLRISIWQFLIPLLIGIIITLVSFPQGFTSLKFILFLCVYSLSMGIPFFKIYEYTEWKLDQHISWLNKPILRFILSVSIELVFGILILFVVNYVVISVVQQQGSDILFDKTSEGLVYLLIFIFSGILVVNSIHFLKNWRESAILSEKLKREKLISEYETLKNQINPHFLFNSFSVLTSLVNKDKDKAIVFIRELSNTFRYVLENHEKDMIDLSKELNWLKSVSFLYKIRYEDSLQISIRLPESPDIFILPLALQMLIENAIKHNAASAKYPLLIEITQNEEYIIVKNNLQPKQGEIISNKVGLKNIILRYKYLTTKDIYIENTGTEFIVKIPILRNTDV